MRTTAPWAVALVLTLAGCGTTEPQGSAGSTGPAPVESGTAGPSWPQLGPGQRLALRQGCRVLHGRDFTKYNQCVAGENRSQEALEQGCAQRYAGNPEMIRSCRTV